MAKPKWIWDAVKILSGLAASATLQFSKVPDKPMPGYTPPGPSDPQHMLPGLIGVAQTDWITTSVWAGTLAAAVVALDGLLGLIREHRLRITEEKKKDIEKAVLGVLKVLSRHTGIDIVYLGGTVFERKTKLWGGFKLKTLLRYRLDDYPPPSGIKWQGEKGAIGSAVEKKTFVHANWVKHSADLNAGDDVLADIPEDQRFGLDDEELKLMVKRYYESLATPIISADGSRVLGVLAVDVPFRDDLRHEQAVLGDSQMQQTVLTSAAALISRALER